MQPRPIADTVRPPLPNPPPSLPPLPTPRRSIAALRSAENRPVPNSMELIHYIPRWARGIERTGGFVMDTLNGKTLFITGASRGIGLAIALRAAADGANVGVAAKTAETKPKLPGTIFTAARGIERGGGKALPLQVDIRFEDQIAAAAAKAAETFGGVDILVNNASAISLTGTLQTPMKRFDLMFGVNVRGTFAASQALLPYLMKAKNPHILNLSPPPSLDPKWFRNHCA